MRAWLWLLLLLVIVFGARWRVRGDEVHAFDLVGVALLASFVAVRALGRRR